MATTARRKKSADADPEATTAPSNKKLAPAYPPGFKLPKTLGAAIDELYKRRDARYALQRDLTLMENAERALKDYIINTLPKSDTTGAAGKLARAQVLTKVVPTITDFDELWTWARRNNVPEVFQRRLAVSTVQERWEAKKEVPGVGRFNAIEVSITKL